eukprot:12079308-Ditylum_brightwellii.AAC.1
MRSTTSTQDDTGYNTIDILIPSQALPQKITKAQRKINNAKHHGDRMEGKDEGNLQLYSKNVNGIAAEEDMQG